MDKDVCRAKDFSYSDNIVIQEAGDEFQVVLQVRHQGFHINSPGTREHAIWLAGQLKIALERLVDDRTSEN